jgi:hypothetical protein
MFAPILSDHDKGMRKLNGMVTGSGKYMDVWGVYSPVGCPGINGDLEMETHIQTPVL